MSEIPYRMAPPGDLTFLSVVDPYVGLLHEFAALKQLGYPVDMLEPNEAQVSEFLATLNDEGHAEWALQHGFKLFLPVVLDEGFVRYVGAIDALTEVFDLELVGALGDSHPVDLADKIDAADTGMLAHYIDQFQTEGKLPYCADPTPDGRLITAEFLEECFVAAYERLQAMTAANHPYFRAPRHNKPQAERNLYAELVGRGVRPVSPERIGGLFFDLYRRAGELEPEFAAFRQR
ncbi:MAG: hypothetical protein JWM81_777 [Candidatus Saccharibacteria bacterium]|nr:hypothetical protein [Candidatus Saccharibacteria bacterium]